MLVAGDLQGVGGRGVGRTEEEGMGTLARCFPLFLLFGRFWVGSSEAQRPLFLFADLCLQVLDSSHCSLARTLRFCVCRAFGRCKFLGPNDKTVWRLAIV